jgi:outer membrane protein
LGDRPINRFVILLLFCLAPALLSSCILSFRKPLVDFVWPAKTASPNPQNSDCKQSAQVGPITSEFLAAAPPDGLLELTLSEAIMVGLENNRALQVGKLNPPITGASEQSERAAFDPVARALLEKSRQRSDFFTVNKDFKANTGVSQFLPTGTTLDFEVGTEWNPNFPLLAGSGSASTAKDPLLSDWKSYSKVSVTQALLRGGGVATNLVGLRQARLATHISIYELTGLAQATTAEIELAYWEYFSALVQVHIYSRSFDRCNRWIKETRERIGAGQKAKSDIYFFQAQAATSEQSLVDARSLQEKTRIRLLRLISPPSVTLWDRPLRLLTNPIIPKDPIENIQSHVDVALRMRPDLNQAKLQEQKGELDVVKTKNGLLPRLDLFIQLGRTGYSASFENSLQDYSSGDGGADLIGRLKLELPVFNRKANADYNRSLLGVAQQREAVNNLIQLAQQDILLAYTEIHRARAQMRVAASLVKFQLEKRNAEVEKYRLGISSADKMAQAERDTVTGEISALRARIDYLKGLTQFYVADGSLLARRRIGFDSQNN